MGKTLAFIAAYYFLYLLTESEAQNCESKYGPAGSISIPSHWSSIQKCWNIYVPFDSFIRINLTKLSLGSSSCSYGSLKISVKDTGETYTYCEVNAYTNPVTALNNVTVNFYARSWNGYSSLEVNYEIQDIECSRKDSFHCTRYSCIPRSKVCDGIKHCENGEDEVGCETGVLFIDGVAESRESAIKWLKKQSTTAWGWKDNTPRAVVALFLASAANFNGTVLEEELLVKQAELRIAVSLYSNVPNLWRISVQIQSKMNEGRLFIESSEKNIFQKYNVNITIVSILNAKRTVFVPEGIHRFSLTNSDLSMLVNALLVTCHNPRHFFGKNLVKRLKTQVEATQNFIHPVAYLALCNANETWPKKAMNDLNGVLSSDSDYPFVRDIQAMAVMALSCVYNFNKDLGNVSKISTLYKEAIRRFKTLQQQDGSFGNAYTTSLITQALIASGHEHSKDWKLSSTVEYLMRELNSSSVDFLSMYLSLPILNGKTLADISKTNCTANPRKQDDIVSEINDYLGFKIQIKYFLYVEEEKNVIYSISLKVPENFTAYEVMKLAAAEDPKYRFEEKRVSGKIYIYKLANITNDPEVGKFWLMYINSTNNGTNEFTHSAKGPDEVVMKDGQHLVMWYKTAHL